MNRRFQKSIILIKSGITKGVITEKGIAGCISTFHVNRMAKNKCLQNCKANTDRISKNIKGIHLKLTIKYFRHITFLMHSNIFSF